MWSYFGVYAGPRWFIGLAYAGTFIVPAIYAGLEMPAWWERLRLLAGLVARRRWVGSPAHAMHGDVDVAEEPGEFELDPVPVESGRSPFAPKQREAK